MRVSSTQDTTETRRDKKKVKKLKIRINFRPLKNKNSKMCVKYGLGTCSLCL